MGQLGDFTIDQAAGSLALVLGSIGGLCLILFKSRCETISICWGVWACNRKVLEEVKEEDKKEDKKTIKPLLQTDSIGIPIQSPEPEPEPNP